MRLYRLVVTDRFAALGLVALVLGSSLLAANFLTWAT